MVRIELHPRPGNRRGKEQARRTQPPAGEKERPEKTEGARGMGGRKTLEIVPQGDPLVPVLRTVPTVRDLLHARTYPTGAQLDQVRRQPGDDSRQNHGGKDARPGGSPQAHAYRQRNDTGRQQKREIPVTR